MSDQVTFPEPRERAMRALLASRQIVDMSKPEVFILAYERAWDEAMALAVEIETAINGPVASERD